MSTIKSSTEHLTLNADGAGKEIKFQANGVEVGTSASMAFKDKDQSWTGSQRGTTVVDNDGSFDMNVTNNFSATLASNVTLTFTNQTSGQSGYILLDNTGGYTVSAHANTKVDANFLATVSTAGVYLCSYFSNGTNTYVTNSGAMV